MLSHGVAFSWWMELTRCIKFGWLLVGGGAARKAYLGGAWWRGRRGLLRLGAALERARCRPRGWLQRVAEPEGVALTRYLCEALSRAKGG